MKQIYMLITALCFSIATFAQTYPLVTIRDIQEVPVDSLGVTLNGDLSTYDGDTVTVRGVVVTPPGAAVSSSTQGRWIWIQDGNGPWSGLNVRYGGSPTPTTPDDMLNVVPGDSVEITGVVNTFANETQLAPLQDGFSILTGVTGLRPVQIQSFSDLSDFVLPNQAIPHSVNGEPLEGSFVEIVDLDVVSVTVTSADIRFIVADQMGNEVQIYDTYTVLQPSPPGNVNEIPYPPFNPPVVGDKFDTIRGIVDGRQLATFPYGLAPFDTTHFVFGPSAPKVTNIFRDIQVPTDQQQVTVTATIADNGGAIVGSPQLFYAFGENNTNFTPVNMTFTGSNNLYTGVIPSGTDGQMVKFYIQAEDNDNNVVAVPNSDPNDTKFFYFVKNSGALSIEDVQYVPSFSSTGESGYVGQIVTVQGVVTASIADNDLEGSNWIQDVNSTEWGGIRVVSSIVSSNFNNSPKGELVEVTGIVEESFGFTQIEISDNNDYQVLTSAAPLNPIDLNPDDFTTYTAANEKYEGMLLRFTGATANDSVFVVATSADGGSDFGEFRVGRDKFDPNTGARVLVGRGGGSLNVSYTTPNVTLAGPLLVPQIIVNQADRMTSVSGVMYYSFSNFKLLPRNNSDFVGYVGGTPVSLSANTVQDRTLSIYPNPSNGELSFVSRFDDKAYNLEIYNLLGEKVWEENANGKVSNYDISRLVNGQYILRVRENGNFVESFQLIIDK